MANFSNTRHNQVRIRQQICHRFQSRNNLPLHQFFLQFFYLEKIPVSKFLFYFLAELIL